MSEQILTVQIQIFDKLKSKPYIYISIRKYSLNYKNKRHYLLEIFILKKPTDRFQKFSYS